MSILSICVFVKALLSLLDINLDLSVEIWYFPCHAIKTFPIWFWFMEMRSIGPKDRTGSGLNRSRGGLETLGGTCHVLSFQSRNTWKIELGVRQPEEMCVAASLEGIPWYYGQSSRFVFCYLPPSWTFNHGTPISINQTPFQSFYSNSILLLEQILWGSTVILLSRIAQIVLMF